MHPILADSRRLAVYVAAWALLGVVLALPLAGADPSRWLVVAVLVLPLADLYAFICLAAWYPCRLNPVTAVSPFRLAAVHLASAALSSALWLLLGGLWSRFISRYDLLSGAAELFTGNVLFFFATGVLLYLLAVAVHYLLAAFEASRRAEARALELKLLAGQAELEAFKAQIDPHFLFNCLNSISSLAGSDPPAAREMAIRLGSFLRATVEHGAEQSIPLATELELARIFVGIERVRFGDRLTYEEEVDESCTEIRVPALLLQPLLENAIKHGISHRLKGGTVRLEARRRGDELVITVDNPCDPDRPSSSAHGIGLANVRGRLRLLYGAQGRLEVDERSDRFTVRVHLPVSARAVA